MLKQNWVYVYPKQNTTLGINMIVPEQTKPKTYKFKKPLQVILFLIKHFSVFL